MSAIERARVVTAPRPLGGVPIPLRHLEDDGTIEVEPLPAGTVGVLLWAYGQLTVILAESIPPNLRPVTAEHCYRQHRTQCRTMTCAVARALLPSAELACEAVTA